MSDTSILAEQLSSDKPLTLADIAELSDAEIAVPGKGLSALDKYGWTRYVHRMTPQVYSAYVDRQDALIQTKPKSGFRKFLGITGLLLTGRFGDAANYDQGE